MKYFYTCIFLCATFFISVAQPVGPLFRKADSLFGKGEYFPASVEYARISFNHPDGSDYSMALLKRARCLKYLGRYNEAVNVLHRINPSGLSDSMHYLVMYETAVNAFLDKDYQEAEAQFKQMDFFIHDSTLTQPALYFRVLTMNELRKWEEAELYFTQLTRLENINQQDTTVCAILDLYHEQVPKMKDAEKAGLMSSFIPGLGQMYAGYPGEAMLSFGLNAICLAGGAYLIYQKYYLTGWLAGLGLLGRFYQGGSRRAMDLAEKRNLRVSDEFNRKIQELLLQLQQKTRH